MTKGTRLGVGLALLAVLAALPFFLQRVEVLPPIGPLAGIARGRDVMLLTLDTTRPDHLGCYGYERETSPALDELAAAGIRFERAYAAAPVTLPAHTTILTGQHPVRHGVRGNSRYVLGAEARTLAEHLRAAGYQTGAFVGAAVLDGRYGLTQGFEHYGDDLGGEGAASFAIGERPASAVASEALAWLDRRDPALPSFVWLHFFDPHHPWTPSDALRERFGRRDVDLYDAEIRVADDALATFRRELATRGIEPLWAVLSDHGEGLAEHGERGHGSLAYDSTTRIVFLLSGAGLPAGRVSRALARQIDLLPTLLDLLGLEAPEDVDGRSLVREGPEEEPEVYLEARLGYEEYGWSPVYGLVKERWKFVEAPLPELFDLDADPREERNLVASEPARAEDLRRALARYHADARSAAAPVADPEHERMLGALGYVAGGGLAQAGEVLPDPKDMLDIAEKLSRAKSLLVSGPKRDPLAAIALFEEVLRVNPANGDALSWLGREAWREAERDPAGANRAACAKHARSAFERLRERAPERAEGEFGLGLVAALEGDVAGAIAHYEKALALEPAHQESLANLMRTRFLRGEWGPVVELSARLLALDEGNREALQFGGLAHHRAGAHAAAIELLERLLPARDAVEHNGLHFTLGECQRLSGHPAEALVHYAEVREPDRTVQGVPALEEQCRAAVRAGG